MPHVTNGVYIYRLTKRRYICKWLHTNVVVGDQSVIGVVVINAMICTCSDVGFISSKYAYRHGRYVINFVTPFVCHMYGRCIDGNSAIGGAIECGCIDDGGNGAIGAVD